MKYIYILLIAYTNCLFAQDDFKLIFNEEFNSNVNSWSLLNTQLRQTEIINGKLYDYFAQDKSETCNLISVKNYNSKEFRIRISLANLHNNSGYKYRVYKVKSNGELIQKWQTRTKWGVIWGYKDSTNYNAIIFSRGDRGVLYKVYSINNGKEYIHTNWTESLILKNNSSFNEIIINRREPNYTMLKFNNEFGDVSYDINWYGPYIGIYIGSGAKVCVDYIKVEEATPCYGKDYTIKMGDIALNKENYAEAISCYTEVIKLGCESANLYYKRASANYLRKYYASARDDYSIAIYLSPNNEEAYYYRGLCKLELDDVTGIDDLKKGGDEGKMLVKEIESQVNVSSQPQGATGSGLVISTDGYIITNEHVVGKAVNVYVYVVSDGKKQGYKARIVKVDKANDLAILKINDSKFINYTNIPYGVKPFGVRVGESVFAMGFPQIDLQGDEIKVTDGIISSLTGFQNDVTTYQISAPIQHGNSGGPLFDKKGNLIGITNAGITASNNVGYAIKSSYLMNMLELFKDIDLNYVNSVSDLSFPDLIEKLSSYVVLVDVNYNVEKENSTSTRK